MEKEKCCRAVFTVEAALLMGIILPVLVSVIIIGFYVHDAGILQGLACETASMGSNYSARKDGNLQDLAETVSVNRTIWVQDVSSSAKVDRKNSKAEFSGEFPVPGLIAHFLNGGCVTLKGKWKRKILQPAKTIRMIRGAEYLVHELDG